MKRCLKNILQPFTQSGRCLYQIMEQTKWRKIAVVSYASFFVLFYAVLILKIEPLIFYTDTIGLIGNLMAFPLFWLGLKNYSEEQKLPWRWFILSSFIYFIGEALWAYYDNFVGTDPSSPSICDVFYIMNTCTFFCGLVCYLSRRESINTMAVSFDMVISIFAAGGLIYNFMILPILLDASQEFWAMMIMLFYPVVDFALLIGLLLMVFGSDHRRFFTRANLIIGVAFFVMFATDQLSLMEKLYNFSLNGMYEPFWSAFCWLLALASTYPDEAHESENLSADYAAKREKILEYGRILLPYVFTFMILFLLGVQYDLLGSFFNWAMLMVFFLSLRQIMVLMRNKRLLRTIQKNEEKLNLQNIELQKLNQRILHDAEVDFLTQLSNRRHIDQAFLRLRPPEGRAETLGVMLIDVDFFKRINDTFGHQKGDVVLQTVAASISSILRGGDIAGRFGGDEFIVLLPGADTDIVVSAAQSLTKRIHKNETLAAMKVTLSIGCTSWCVTQKDYDVKRLLKQADDALYVAKAHGRNQYVSYDDVKNSLADE